MNDRSGDLVAIGNLLLDLSVPELRAANGKVIRLRPRALDVLCQLARHADQLVTKQRLLDSVWQDVVVTEHSLTQCIKEIRQALDDRSKRQVVSEPRRGYRLELNSIGDSLAFREHLSDEEFVQEIRYAPSRDGTRIAYANAGRGERFIVRAKHWMSHLEFDWRNPMMGGRIRDLASHSRLIRYDGRGWGLSERDIDPGHLDDWVEDIHTVVDAAGVDRFALFALSGGAYAAIQFAALYPDRVSHLILFGATSSGPLRRGASEEQFEAICTLIRTGWAQDNPAFRQIIATLMFPGANAEQMAAYNTMQRVACSGESAAIYLKRLAQTDVTASLSAITCPTLVLHCLHDSRTPFDEARKLAMAIPNAQLVGIDSRNHLPLPGEPGFAVSSDAIRRFLEVA